MSEDSALPTPVPPAAPPASGLAYRIVLAAAAAAAIIAGSWSLLVVVGRGEPQETVVLVELTVTALGAAMLGLWMVVRMRPREDLVALSLGLVNTALAWSLFVAAYGPEPTPLTKWILWTLGDAGVITGSAGILRFLSLFPRRITEADLLAANARQLARLEGKKREKKERELKNVFKVVAFFQGRALWPAACGAAAALGALLAFLVLPSGRDLESDAVFFALTAPGMFGIAWGSPLAVYLSTLIYRGEDPHDRRRLQWIHWGLTAAVFAFMLFGALMTAGILVGFESQALVSTTFGAVAIAPLVVLVGVAVAVLYDGSVDPALMIRRTTVYGILSVTFVFLFAALGNIVSELVEARLGLPGIVGSGLYGGTLAVVLLPMRGRLSRLMDRFRGPLAAMARQD